MGRISLIKGVHKDCPLTKEEINAVKAELYYVNSTNHCINPSHPTWWIGLNQWQCDQISKHKSDYKAWLKKELKELEDGDTFKD